MSKSYKALEGLGCFVLALIFVIGAPAVVLASIVTSGFVLQSIWEWFVSPLGLPTIGLFHAAGIVLTVRYLATPDDYADLAKAEKTEFHKKYPIRSAMSDLLGQIVLRPAIIYGIGWLIHYAMVNHVI